MPELATSNSNIVDPVGISLGMFCKGPLEVRSPDYLTLQSEELVGSYLADREEINNALKGRSAFSPAGSEEVIEIGIIGEAEDRMRYDCDKITFAPGLAGLKARWGRAKRNSPVMRRFYGQFRDYHTDSVRFHDVIIDRLGIPMGPFRVNISRLLPYIYKENVQKEDIQVGAFREALNRVLAFLGQKSSQKEDIQAEETQEGGIIKIGMRPHTDDDKLTTLRINGKGGYYWIDKHGVKRYLTPERGNCIAQGGTSLLGRDATMHGVEIFVDELGYDNDNPRVTLATYDGSALLLRAGNHLSKEIFREREPELRELGLIF